MPAKCGKTSWDALIALLNYLPPWFVAAVILIILSAVIALIAVLLVWARKRGIQFWKINLPALDNNDPDRDPHSWLIWGDENYKITLSESRFEEHLDMWRKRATDCIEDKDRESSRLKIFVRATEGNAPYLRMLAIFVEERTVNNQCETEFIIPRKNETEKNSLLMAIEKAVATGARLKGYSANEVSVKVSITSKDTRMNPEFF